MDKNKHDIKTIWDILKVVNSKNKENFLKDFSAWLDINIYLKEQVKKARIEKAVNIKSNFIWIDDGKNDISVNIKVKGK